MVWERDHGRELDAGVRMVSPERGLIVNEAVPILRFPLGKMLQEFLREIFRFFPFFTSDKSALGGHGTLNLFVQQQRV